MKITSNEFFDYLENDLISGVLEHNQKKILASDVKKGLTYTINQEDLYKRVKVTVLEYKRGHYYKSKVESVADTITLKYETEETEKGLQIIFNQSIGSFESKKHNMFMRLFSEGVYYGRMSDTLYDIQKKIHNERDIDK